MSILDSIVHRARGRPVDAEQKAVIVGDAQRIGVQERPRYPDVSPDALGKAYRRNELVYACVRAKADAMADPRLIVEARTSDGTYEEVRGHPLRRLLMRPNDAMDEAAFFKALIVSLDIFGWFVCERLVSQAGALVGLNPLNPAKLTPNEATVEVNGLIQRQLVGYTWRDGGSAIAFTLDQLIIYRPVDWLEPPALEVALGAVDADNAQTDYVRAFFNNAGVPSGILKVRGTYDQPKADHLRMKWRAQYGRGTGRQHDIAVLDDNADYQRIGATIDELNSEALRSVAESRICMVFKVPPLIVYAYVGLLRATYSNLKEAYAGFWDLTLSPLLKAVRAWLTWTLLIEYEPVERLYDEQIRLRWDLTAVAALQDDVDAAQTRARANFQAGALTLNEFRAAIGTLPDPVGDYYLRTVALAPVAQGMTPDDDTPEARTARQHAAVKTLKSASTSRIEARLRVQLERYLIEQYDAAAAAAAALLEDR
jgi:HK97 family phage portal protein